jgi:uncharacterized protein DUF6491
MFSTPRTAKARHSLSDRGGFGMNRPSRWLWITAAVALVACSSLSQRTAKDQAERDRYVSYAGTPIEQFTYLGRFDSWHALSRSELVVFTTFNNAYLLKVWQPCIGLQFAHRVGVSSTAGTVHRGLDSVLVDDQRCPSVALPCTKTFCVMTTYLTFARCVVDVTQSNLHNQIRTRARAADLLRGGQRATRRRI